MNSSVSSFLFVQSDDFQLMLQNYSLHTDLLIEKARRIVEKHRRRLINAAPQDAKYHLDKLLDAMLDCAPTKHGARYVAVLLHFAETKDPAEGRYVIDAAKAWLDYLLLPMLSISKADKSQPISAETPEFDNVANVIESADRAEQREFKAALAVRENYRCALTQAFDLNRVVFLKKCGRGSEIPSGAAVLSMHAAHIIPLSLNSFSEMGERQAAGTVDFKDAAVTSAMLQSWTNIDLGGLVGPKITTLQNGIYMTRDNHIGFGRFKIYLEADPVVPNQYEARCYDMLLTDGSETRIVNFNTPEPPSPQLIGIHAAFARVLHLSGAADHHEDLERDAERMEMLYSQGLIDIGQALPSQLAVLGGGVVYVRPQVAY